MKKFEIPLLFVWAIWSLICFLGIWMFETVGSYFYRLGNSNAFEVISELPTLVGLLFPLILVFYFCFYLFRWTKRRAGIGSRK